MQCCVQCYHQENINHHLQGALHSFLTADNFAETIRQTIKAGGCNCSRALFAGALAGAKYGLNGIPRKWIQKSTNALSVMELSINVMKL